MSPRRISQVSKKKQETKTNKKKTEKALTCLISPALSLTCPTGNRFTLSPSLRCCHSRISSGCLFALVRGAVPKYQVSAHFWHVFSSTNSTPRVPAGTPHPPQLSHRIASCKHGGSEDEPGCAMVAGRGRRAKQQRTAGAAPPVHT